MATYGRAVVVVLPRASDGAFTAQRCKVQRHFRGLRFAQKRIVRDEYTMR